MSSSTFPEIHDLINRQIAAKYAQQEAELREQLTRRVERAIENTNDLQRAPMARLFAEAAVQAFIDFVNEGPGV